MICLVCRQAEVVNGFTSVKLERGEFRLVLNEVPAHLCPDCGEAYVDEEVAARLLQSAEETYKAGILDSHTGYTTARI